MRILLSACLLFSLLFYSDAHAFTGNSGPADGLPVNIDINVYPNPSASHITISSDMAASEVTGISLMDMSGKTLVTIVPQAGAEPIKYTIDMSNYPMGIYLVKVDSKNGTVVKKVVKNS